MSTQLIAIDEFDKLVLKNPKIHDLYLEDVKNLLSRISKTLKIITLENNGAMILFKEYKLFALSINSDYIKIAFCHTFSNSISITYNEKVLRLNFDLNERSLSTSSTHHFTLKEISIIFWHLDQIGFNLDIQIGLLYNKTPIYYLLDECILKEIKEYLVFIEYQEDKIISEFYPSIINTKYKHKKDKNPKYQFSDHVKNICFVYSNK